MGWFLVLMLYMDVNDLLLLIDRWGVCN